MDSNPLKIPKKISDKLLYITTNSPNIEICGLIGIKNDCCNTCYPINNVAKHPETNYQLDLHQQISTLKEMRKKNEKQLAIYHSHPSTPATPSETDIDLASYPDAIYLIISTQSQPNIRGFTIKNKTAQEISLEIKTT